MGDTDTNHGHTISPPTDQTQFEYISDAILGVVFLILVIVSAQRYDRLFVYTYISIFVFFLSFFFSHKKSFF